MNLTEVMDEMSMIEVRNLRPAQPGGDCWQSEASEEGGTQFLSELKIMQFCLALSATGAGADCEFGWQLPPQCGAYKRRGDCPHLPGETPGPGEVAGHQWGGNL